MANYCAYDMHVAGKSDNIDEFIARLDYNHTPHFWRVFDATVQEHPSDDNLRHVEIYGACAWSVHSCMREGFGTYASEYVDTSAPTSLVKSSAELNLEIEVYSEEPANGFAEHYHYKNGETLVDAEAAYNEYYYEDGEYESFYEFLKEWNLPPYITENDLDEGVYCEGGFKHVFFDD